LKRVFGALPTRYARSLFFAALKSSEGAAVERDMAAIHELFRENRELPLLLANPSLGTEKRRGILTRVGEKLEFCMTTKRFLELLLEKSRLDLLPTIPEYYHRLWQDHESVVEVKVSTAVPLTDSMKQTVSERIAARSGKKPQITFVTDASLIGGIVVSYPDRILDGSLRRKVQQLKQRMVERV
jgi:F-type H+-transporting ATPase subunit delta